MSNPVAEAAELLRTDGWMIGAMKCGDGRRCAVGALRAACDLSEYVGMPYAHDDQFEHPYVKSLTALCEAISPAFRRSKYMRGSLEDYGVNSFFELSLREQIALMEDYVINYNDGRTETPQGRNAVLGRFDKAAANLATV